MSRLPGFVGPTNQNRSVNVDAERTINFVWEASGAGTPKVPASMYGRPGLAPFAALGPGPVRQLFAQDGRAFGVSGTLFCEFYAAGTRTVRGSVAADGNPATICSNGGADGSGGHQLFIVSGGHGYIFDLVANTLTEITAAGFPTPVLMGAYIDGYFIALKAESNQFNLSNLEDGTLWDALDVAEISQWPGQILSLVTSRNELWPFSSTRVNPWYDSGATFPFQPILGSMMDVGIAAPWSAVNLDNTLYWVGATAWGGPQVFRANGYQPDRISTFAVETTLQGLSRIDDAIAWPCQMGGHAWYVLYLPEHDTTLVYDAASGLWTEWATWDEDLIAWRPFPGRCHTFAFGQQLVGDRQTGMVYRLSFDVYSDTVAIA